LDGKSSHAGKETKMNKQAAASHQKQITQNSPAPNDADIRHAFAFPTTNHKQSTMNIFIS